MSKLSFNGATHRISLIDHQGARLGTWPAYNNVDSHAAIQPHLANGSYVIRDRVRPRPHAANPNGPYGSYGIIRFGVSGHVGVGVHSGRANASHLPGPPHPTMGCIRTSNDAMRHIHDVMANDPLTVVEVAGNSQASARVGHLLQGGHHVHP